MIRLVPLVVVLIFAECFASTTLPAVPGYTLNAKAIRSGERIVVTFQVANATTRSSTVGESPNTPVKPVATPRISMLEGQHAEVTIGEPQGGKSRTLKIDCISVKGGDHLIVVADIAENGETVWAEAKTIPISTD